VNIEKNVWCCNHCGWAGTLLAGAEKPRLLHWQKPTYRVPDVTAGPIAEQAKKWLLGRGISAFTLEQCGVFSGSVYMPQVEDFVTAIAFPYRRNGEIVNVKWRDGQKNFRLESGAERILYGLDDIDDVTIIVEGEIDKLSCHTAGFPNCVSVPDGAPAENTKEYGSKFDYLAAPELERVKTWILAVDNDGPGLRLENELARRFGHDTCVRVAWPAGCKDANDTLQQYGVDMLRGCIQNATPYPIEGAFGIDDVEAELDKLFTDGMPKGQSTGWHEMDDFLTLLPGQMTIVTGVPSHGKSEWLDALTMNLAEQGWRFGMYSPENHPIHFHLAKLAEKHMGTRFGIHADRGQYEFTKAWLRDHYWLIAPEEPTLDCVLDIAKRMVRTHGINGLVIDPWNEIEHSRTDGSSETEYVSKCLTKIRLFARRSGVHVFIVAHPTKLQKDKDGTYPIPTPYDISGSAHWRNKADNCITVWRDVADETKPSEIHVQKVRFRFLGKVGAVELHWMPESGRYSDEAPIRYSGL
jgi:twinkle protein